ncbi:MAG: chemotaxis protein CheW, partial [Bacteroidota bacterium]|nr:chemotaxis protein CheW [Bacteroidota bacterium]
MNKNNPEKWIGILVFKIASVEFGSNIDEVQLIHSVEQYRTREGKIIIKGKEIPVFNIAEIFDTELIPTRKYQSFLLYEADEQLYGFWVDEVKEVLPLDEKAFEN